jgi:SpoVK/Ycf46/Vps4 family AAA+-type ATPase
VPRSVLPERHTLVRSIDSGKVWDLVAEVDDVLVLLRCWKNFAEVWTTAACPLRAEAVVREVTERMPPKAEGNRIDVVFTDAETGTRSLPVETRPWATIRSLYAEPVQHALDVLMTHRPLQDEARRLMLWHGEPGTGKTSAIRALLNGWRDWADGTIVSDPEALLASGKYLRRVMLDPYDDDKWQVVVLEDAESLLKKGGDGRMAKLLNLCDGLLGQGLRCLFLITTNEPLASVHPALVRPGRCLSRVEFGLLPAAQASGLLGRPVASAMSLAEVMAAKPVTAVAEPVAIGQYL